MTYYRIKKDFQAEYKLGPSILVRVDSRGVRGGFIYTYAPISTNGKIIYSEKFEDTFEEVEPI